MEQSTLNLGSENVVRKDIDKNSFLSHNKKHEISSSNEIIYKNQNKEEEIPEKKPNRFTSFLFSKIGIVIIISIILVLIIGIVLGVVLKKKNNKKDENEKIIKEENEEVNEEKNEEIKEEEIKEEEDNYIYKGKLNSDTLYVKKIENLPDDFIFGMDLSSLIVEENSGVKFYNFENEEKDILELLRYVGINYIRIRIWNDPYDSEGHGYGGGNNDMETAIKIGKRATKYGMKILASFHYSDFYADPGSQNVPKAWRGLTLDEKVKKAEEFTLESLTKFKNEGVNVGMVAIGNEINNFFCGETEWPNIVKIMNACSKVIRQFSQDILISVHFTNPERVDSLKYFADSLYENNLDYDAFSVSYYNVLSGDISCLNQFNYIVEKYNKKVYIAETNFPYTRDNLDYYPNMTPGYDSYLFYPMTVQGQATNVREYYNFLKDIKNALGIFYWEGAWIAVGTTSYDENKIKWETFGSGWASSYSSSYDSRYEGGGGSVENLAFFDSEGKPLESLKIYNLMKYGNEDVEIVEDAVEDISVNPINFTNFSIPTSINVIYTSNEKKMLKLLGMRS